MDPQAPIGDTRVKRIIIHGLRPTFKGFLVAVQGWQIQPSLVEFENLLTGQEALTKNMGRDPLKGEEKMLYANKSSWNPKQQGGSKRNEDKIISLRDKGSSRAGGAMMSHLVAESSEGSATIPVKRVTKHTSTGRRKSSWKVILLPLIMKKNGISRHCLLQKRRWLLQL